MDPTLLLSYANLTDIFRSWFWRYYDHLGRLVLYNFLWFLTLVLAAWTAGWTGFLKMGERIDVLGIYFFYLAACILSMGWAYSIFRIFNAGRTSFSDLWVGTRKYFVKALGLSAVSGLVLGLAVYNIGFYLRWSAEHKVLGLFLSGFLVWVLVIWMEMAFYHWPVLFFQDPPFLKIFYRSFLLALDNGWATLRILLFFLALGGLFFLAPVGLIFLGPVFFFSLQCVTLEKHFLKYKITYQERPLAEFLEALEGERRRGWRDFWRPWENR